VAKAEAEVLSQYVTLAQMEVDKVMDETVKENLQSRLAIVKEQIAKNEMASSAELAVVNAEKYQYSAYVRTAQSKVDQLPAGEFKNALQARLDKLKPDPADVNQDQAVIKAESQLNMAVKYRLPFYVTRAQEAINLVADSGIRANLQARLDAVIVK
jgi:hypothetical protein